VNPTGGAREVSEKRYFTGTHRIRSPEETWERIVPLFPRMGITRVADVTGLDHLGVPVYQAVRPRSKNLSVSQGKGLTRAAARVSAAMESIEMWHAESLDHLKQVRMPLREMEYGNPIDPDTLRWMKGARVFRAAPIQWIELTSLVSGRTAWLPRGMIELDFSAPDLFEPDMFVCNSNGLASGNDLNEAILHSLCELVERHAWHLTQVDPARLIPLDSDSVPDGAVSEMLDDLRSRGAKVGLYDFTWEVGVPAIFVKLVMPDMPVVWHGAGCHTSPDVALSRAVTEAAQSRLTQIAGARDDLISLARGARLRRSYDDYVEPTPQRSFSEIQDVSQDVVGRDVEQVVSMLHQHGFEPFYVDLSLPDTGVSVSLTFAPGLREMHG
jgi:YcaO-like protein with predicted kinase domain